MRAAKGGRFMKLILFDLGKTPEDRERSIYLGDGRFLPQVRPQALGAEGVRSGHLRRVGLVQRGGAIRHLR